jgi:hypothetical protein
VAGLSRGWKRHPREFLDERAVRILVAGYGAIAIEGHQAALGVAIPPTRPGEGQLRCHERRCPASSMRVASAAFTDTAASY